MSPPCGRRKFLSLPAVHPGADVHPAALLHSLAALADDILALRPCAFPVHRRNAREVIREVGAIREFLGDICAREAAMFVPTSAFTCLSELQITLQKLRHLLHDCARPGTRLWVLIRSDQVSNDFRVLVRSIATVLDVLPLTAIEAAEEVKELVRLVGEQAWRAEMDTDPADAVAVRRIWSILGQFKNGIAPDPSDLSQILHHLRTRSWSDCSEEIAFLEDLFMEITIDDNGKGNEKEVALIGSLTAFMVYCRATLFEAADDNKGRASKRKPQTKAMNHVNLEHLRCPISLELMFDPVTIATGHTYERASISKWLKSGCLTCPVTGEKLSSANLVPNSAVRNLVLHLCRDNNINIPEANDKHKRATAKTVSPPSSAASVAVRMAASFLIKKIAGGTNQEKNKAAYEIRKLSKSNNFNRGCLVEAGAVPWLLHLFSSLDPSTQDNAVAALLNLSKHPAGARATVEAGGLGLVIDIIRLAIKAETQQNAAAILFYLSSTEWYRIEIGQMPEAIPTLVELLREPNYRGRRNAVVTLFGLLQHTGNQARVLEAGAVPALVNLLSSEREDLIDDAIVVLAKVAERCDGTAALLDSSAVPRLVEFLRSSNSRSRRESCVSALTSLCVNGGKRVVSLLVKMPEFMPSLYFLVNEGSPKVGKKARSLLNRIHRLNEQGYGAVAAAACQDQVIHAQ